MIYFSIVIPTFNRANKILILLESLLNQTYKNFEVVIVDDGSTDNTNEFVLKYNNLLDIKYFHIQNSGGPARPRNIGIKNSKYDWVCLLDSDDIWTNDKLFQCNKYITKLTNYSIFIHTMYIKNDNRLTKKIIGKFKPNNSKLLNFYNLIYNGNKIITSSLVIKKSCLLEVGFFDERKDLFAIEDLDILLKLFLSDFKIFNIKKILGYYTYANDNISSNELSQINKLRVLYNEYFINYPNLINKNKLDTIIFYKLGNYYKINGKKILALKNYYKVLLNFNNYKLIFKSIIKVLTSIWLKLKV